MSNQNNQRKTKILYRSQLKEIAKSVLTDIERLKQREIEGGFKFSPYNMLSKKEQYKYYANLHNSNRPKAKKALDKYKELSSDILDKVMFEKFEFVIPKFEGDLIEWNLKEAEKNLLQMADRIKETTDLMEKVWECEICLD